MDKLALIDSIEPSKENPQHLVLRMPHQVFEDFFGGSNMELHMFLRDVCIKKQWTVFSMNDEQFGKIIIFESQQRKFQKNATKKLLSNR